MDNRREYIYSQIKNKNARILEIGPLNRPLFETSEYPNVFTADIRSTEQVKALYGGDNNYLSSTGIHVDIDSIVDIDFVIKDTYSSTFENVEKFDYIVASHVLEHIPDLVGWFKDAQSALKKNGSILLVYPDKRYCFDRFRESSTFIQALQVNQENEEALNQRIMDFQINVVNENDPAYWWCNQGSIEHLPQSVIDTKMLGKNTDDIHYWPFSSTGFLKFLCDMERAGMSDYVCTDFRDTHVDDQQFFVTLRRKQDNENMNEANKRLLAFIEQSLQTQDAVVQQALDKAEEANQKLQGVYLELEKTYTALKNDSRQLEQYEKNKQENIALIVSYSQKETEWMTEKARLNDKVINLAAEKAVLESMVNNRKQELSQLCSMFEQACGNVANTNVSLLSAIEQIQKRETFLEQQGERERCLQEKVDQMGQILQDHSVALVRADEKAKYDEKQISQKNYQLEKLQKDIDALSKKLQLAEDALTAAKEQVTNDVRQIAQKDHQLDKLQKDIDAFSKKLQLTEDALTTAKKQAEADEQLIVQQNEKMDKQQLEIKLLGEQLEKTEEELSSMHQRLNLITDSRWWRLRHSLYGFVKLFNRKQRK